MIRIASFSLLTALALSGCTGSGAPPATLPAPPMAGTYGSPKPLIGLDVKRLIVRFGEPRLDIRDRTVRKLQFMTGGCVLDAYLYTTTRGKEPVVTHIDTRMPDGADVDPATCGITG